MAGRILLTLLSAQLALVFVSVLRLGATAQESSLIDCYEAVSGSRTPHSSQTIP